MRTTMRGVLGLGTCFALILGVLLGWLDVSRAQDAKTPGLARAKERETPRERRKRRIPVSRVGLDLSRVPGEDELRAAGQVAGLLDPASPADHGEFEERVDARLKELGLPQGLKTPPVPGAPWLPILEDGKLRVKKSLDSTLLFGQAMHQWNADNYHRALPLMEDLVQRFPESPWAPEALLHIADAAKFTGQPTRAMTLYDELLRVTSGDPETDSYEIHQKIKTHLIDLLLTQGRFSEARPLLLQLRKEDENERRRIWADYWLMQMELIEGSEQARLALRDCSVQALVALANRSDQGQVVPGLKKVTPPSEWGFSLAAMQRIGKKNGLGLVGARSDVTHLKSLPMPLILHYGFSQSREFGRGKNLNKNPNREHKPIAATILKREGAAQSVKRLSVGHFLLLTGVEKSSGKFVLFDPQRKCTLKLSEAELQTEWTGRCLLPSRQVKKEHRRLFTLLPNAEMQRTLGTCYMTLPEGGLGDDATNVNVGTTCTKMGSPVVSVNRSNLNVFVEDTPIWFRSASGMMAAPNIAYNSKDATLHGSVLGDSWVLNYDSYIRTRLYGTGIEATIIMPDGSRQTFQFPTVSQPTVQNSDTFANPSEGGSPNRLERPFGAVYGDTSVIPTIRLLFPDGSRYTYQRFSSGQGTPLYLVQITNRFGVYLNVDRDSNRNVSKISTGTTDLLTFTYEFQYRYSNFLGGNYPANRIIRISDPTGRMAVLTVGLKTPGNIEPALYRSRDTLIESQDMAGRSFGFVYSDVHNGGPLTAVRDLNDQTRTQIAYLTHTSDLPRVQVTQFGVSASRSQNFYYMGRSAQGNHEASFLHTSPLGRSVTYRAWVPPNNVSARAMIDRVSFGGDTEEIAYSNDYSVSFTRDASGQEATMSYVKVGYAQGGLNTPLLSQVTTDARAVPYPNASATLPAPRWTRIKYSPTGSHVTSVEDQLGRSVFTTQTPTFAPDFPDFEKAGNDHQTNHTYTSWGAPNTTTWRNLGLLECRLQYVYVGQTLQSIAYYVHNAFVCTVATFTFDAANRLRSETDPNTGRSKTYNYDLLDRVIGVTYNDASSESVDYSPCCGLPQQTTDRSGRKTTYTYDNWKRLITVKNAQNQTHTMGYDLDDNLTSLTPPSGPATTWQYDDQNRMFRKNYPGGTYEEFTYDKGRLVSERQTNGRVRGYQYNEMNDLVKIDEPSIGSPYPWLYEPDHTFAYNDLGELIGIASPYDIHNMSYDVLGRLLSQSNHFGDTVSYGYDPLGRLASTRLNGGLTTSYDFDNMGRLNTVTSPQGTYRYSYLGNSELLSTLLRPDGSSSTYGYEGAGTLRRLNSVQNFTVPQGLVSSFAYVYGTGTHRDARVQMTRFLYTQPTERVVYGYDNVNGVDANTLDQLTSETVYSGPSLDTLLTKSTFSYDDRGNRISRTYNHSNGYFSVSTHTINDLNQLTAIANTASNGNSSLSLTYDLNGNLTRELSSSGEEKTYIYDTLDRVVGQHRLQGGVLQGATDFYRDGLGRVKDTYEYVNNNGWVYNLSATRSRIYDGMEVLAERDGNGTLVSHYTRAGNIGGVLGMTSYIPNSWPNHYLHYDGSGNVSSMSVTNGTSTGDVSHIRSFNAWGLTNLMTPTTPSYAGVQKWGYSTKEDVGVGLVHYGQRMYRPELGRWLNRDPMGEAGGVNLYGFNHNNPTNYVDPDGRLPILLVVAAGASISGWANVGSQWFTTGEVDGGDVAISSSVGAATALVTPGVTASASLAGTLIKGGALGTVSNAAQYGLTEYSHCRSITPRGLSWSILTGFGGGTVGARFGKPFEFKSYRQFVRPFPLYNNSTADASFLVRQAITRQKADAANQVLWGRNGVTNIFSGAISAVPEPGS